MAVSRSPLALIWLACLWSLGWGNPTALGQTAAATSGSPTSGWTVRDPVTGRVYYQQLVEVSVPTVTWENKQVTTTVLQPQWVSEVVPQTQVVYQPQTQYVMHSYWQGAWNPFRQPTLAYQFRPTTTWVPTTTTTPQVVTRQKLVPQQQTISVPQPVTTTQTRQQLVQTEVPQATAALASQSSPRMAYTLAHQPPPLIRLPLLGGPGALPPPTWTPPAATVQPPAMLAAAPAPLAVPPAGLRPVARSVQNILPPAG